MPKAKAKLKETVEVIAKGEPVTIPSDDEIDIENDSTDGSENVEIPASNANSAGNTDTENKIDPDVAAMDKANRGAQPLPKCILTENELRKKVIKYISIEASESMSHLELINWYHARGKL